MLKKAKFLFLRAISPAWRPWRLGAFFLAGLLGSLVYAFYQSPPRDIPPIGLFYVKPYLQPGDRGELPNPGALESFSLIWQTAEGKAAEGWDVEVKAADDWVKTKEATSKRLAVEGLPPYRLFRALLEGLQPGSPFSYRLSRNGKVEFEATGLARKGEGVPQKFVVFGDSGAGTPEQFPIAYRVFLEKPDYGVITGDIVYARGRVSEYLANHFPIYNHDEASLSTGAPLLRSTLFFGPPGNHDLIERSLDSLPDGLAYFYYWDSPKNGPLKTVGAPQSVVIRGTEAHRNAFLEAAGSNYPIGTNYSLDYGDVHWTVIDSNPYVDWNDSELRTWLEADLASAQGKAWRFTTFHHPGFSSSKAHFEDQRLRILAPIFEKHKVDVVFNGHVHNYQRSFPLKFAPVPLKNTDMVDGEFTLDKAFDGATRTKADGVIYIVTGAGGARLYDPSQTTDPSTWQAFTAKFIADVHSFTVVELTAKSLQFRQISDAGMELDRFTLTH